MGKSVKKWKDAKGNVYVETTTWEDIEIKESDRILVGLPPKTPE